MAILRKRQIENLGQMNGEELEAFLEKLPAGKEDFEKLFVFLEQKQETTEFDDSLRFTMQFLMQNRLNFPKVTAWLNENGGYSDDKILERIVPEWRKVFD